MLDTHIAVEKQVWCSTPILERELAVQEMKFSLIELREPLHLTSLEKLSSTLIN